MLILEENFSWHLEAFASELFIYCIVITRAVQLIEFDSHAHLVSKAGSVIGAKSPSPVSNAAAVNTQSRSSLTSYAISRS